MSKTTGALGMGRDEEEGRKSEISEIARESTINLYQLKRLMEVLFDRYAGLEEGTEAVLNCFYPNGRFTWDEFPGRSLTPPPLQKEDVQDVNVENEVRTQSMITLKPDVYFQVGNKRVMVVFDDPAEARKAFLDQQLARVFLEGFFRKWEEDQCNADNRNAVAGLIHNQNNAIGAVIGWAELNSAALSANKTQPIDPSLKASIRASYEQVRYNSTMALRLLRTGERKVRPELKRANLTTFRNTLFYRYKKHSLRSNIEEDGDYPEELDIDFNLLYQVIDNLVGNAYKYGHPQDQPLEVSIWRLASGVVLTVKDEGRGIGDADPEKLFEFAYRAEHTREQAGYGIGLHFCRQVVEGMGGKINLLSNPGEAGVSFIVKLPLCGRKI